MDAISSVGGAVCAPASTPQAPSVAASSSIVASSSTSITRVGGSSGLEGLANLAGTGKPEDTMKLLVAMLLLEALFGKGKAGEDGKLGGVLALSMLGQAASSGLTMIENSSTLMVSQKGATAAYSQTASVSSMSVMG